MPSASRAKDRRMASALSVAVAADWKRRTTTSRPRHGAMARNAELLSAPRRPLAAAIRIPLVKLCRQQLQSICSRKPCLSDRRRCTEGTATSPTSCCALDANHVQRAAEASLEFAQSAALCPVDMLRRTGSFSSIRSNRATWPSPGSGAGTTLSLRCNSRIGQVTTGAGPPAGVALRGRLLDIWLRCCCACRWMAIRLCSRHRLFSASRPWPSPV